jgi:AbrB family looped-hinge helix DNA binding protein
MGQAATTRLSSKGQVVIPEEIRERLGLKPGDQFVVIGEGDAVILKVLEAPDVSEFAGLVSTARKAAKRVGLQPREISRAISKVRGSR